MLGNTSKKILLGLHILFVAMVTGGVCAILYLIYSRQMMSDHLQFAAVDKSIFLIFNTIVMNGSIAIALTGLIFSMFTSWFFFRYYWIIVKWLAISVLAVIIIFLAAPSISGMAALSDVALQQAAGNAEYLKFEADFLLYSWEQLVLLVTVIFISVIKPWGQRKSIKLINRKVVLVVGIVLGLGLSAGVVMQYLQLSYYRHLEIHEVDLKQIDDGYYFGKADFGFSYEVGVQVENHAITDIDFLKNRNSFYARLAEKIETKIIRQQKINLDAVTAATTTSKILMKAVENSLITGNRR